MINTFEIYQNLKETFGEKEATVLTNLLIKIYNEINQTVTKEEFRVLTEKVVELSEAQKRTEQRVEELAEAQKKTEEVLKNLILTVDDLKKQVGGLSMVVGYGIEDDLMPYIENFVYNQYGAEAKEVERKYIQYDSGKYDEVNIYIKATKNDKDVYIIGECKAQPGKRDIDRFAKMLKRLRAYVQSDVIGFMDGYKLHPKIKEYCKRNYNINTFKTYQVKR